MKKIFNLSLNLFLASFVLLGTMSSLVLAQDKQAEPLSNKTKNSQETLLKKPKAIKDSLTTSAKKQNQPPVENQAQVSYKYQAKDSMGRVITDIPADILATLPKTETKNLGDTANPTQPQKTKFEINYKDRIGTWSFNGWTKKSLQVTGDPTKDVFVGNWTFRDIGFGKSPYLGNQFINLDLQKKLRLGKIYLELKIDRLKNVDPPKEEPFHVPTTYSITALLSDDKGQTRTGTYGDSSKIVATGTYKKDPDWPKWSQKKEEPTEGGYLIDSYGKPVNLPLFDENGVGIQYSIQNLDFPFTDGKNGSDHHPRWWSTNMTPNAAFYPPDPKTGEIVAWTRFFNSYTELVSSEFRSTWITSTPEADRPDIRAVVPPNDPSNPDESAIYIPLLKKNYKDNPENFVRARTDGVNDSWLHNYTYDEDKEQFGLLDHYRDNDTGEEFSDLREKFPVTLEGLDQNGFIEKDGHRFKSSITYDIYDGAFATFQEEYKLTFHTEGGKFADQKTEKSFPVLHGDKLKDTVQNPTREFYVFKGWRVGKDDPVKPFDPATNVTSNMDMYAMWEKKPMVVTEEPKVSDGSGNQVADKDYRKVTFDSNSGAFGGNSKSVSYWILKDASFAEAKDFTNQAGQKVLAIPTANKDDHDWLGWSQDKSKTTGDYKSDLTNFQEAAGSTADLTFYAIYKEKAKGTVEYKFEAKDASGATVAALPQELAALLPTDNTRYLLGTKVQPKAVNQTKVDGTYDGKPGTWSFGNWTPTEVTIKENGNTFTGVWTFAVKEYKLTFHTEGGKFADQKTEKSFPVLHGDKLKDTVQNPTREFYVFKGWRVGKDDPVKPFDPATNVTSNMDMYAMWEKAKEENPKPNDRPGQDNPNKPTDETNQNTKIDQLKKNEKAEKELLNTGDAHSYILDALGLTLVITALTSIIRRRS